MTTDLAAYIAREDGTTAQLDDWTVVHVLRNPYGWTEDAIRACRLYAANVLDERVRRTLIGKPHARDAYLAAIRSGTSQE